MLVNHKAIAAKSKLQLHKVATDKKEKSHKANVAVDVLREWATKREALSLKRPSQRDRRSIDQAENDRKVSFPVAAEVAADM